jgi:hypothetical protein
MRCVLQIFHHAGSRFLRDASYGQKIGEGFFGFDLVPYGRGMFNKSRWLIYLWREKQSRLGRERPEKRR